mmetsp:Transcript_16022/g.38273  ORF Transcript_16022/g.38273 Transcript_16022/m.38273 type:complete len:599 (-) Transcript_16022:236-2032(-)
MEDVRARGVVNNDGLRQVAVQQAQVLDVVALVVDAGLAEQPGADGLVRVEEVEEGVGVLVEGGGVHDDLVVLGHLDEELVDARPLHHVHEVDDVLDLDGDDEVGAGDGPEAGVDQRLVEVEDEALLPEVVGMVRREELHLVLGRGVLVQDLLLRLAGGVLRPLSVLVVVRGRVPRDGGRPAGAGEGGGVGRRGAPDGLGGGRRAGVLGEEAAAHHPEGFQEGVAGVDVDPAASASAGPGRAVLLVGVAALDLVRVELVAGVVDGPAVGRDVDVRLGTRGMLPPRPGDGVGAPGRGGVAVLVGLGDEVGDGDLVLGGGRRGRGDGGLVAHVDRRAAAPGGEGGLPDARAAQVAPAADSGGSLGLAVLGRGRRRGVRPGRPAAPRLATAVAAAAVHVCRGGGGAALVVLRVGGPGIDVRASAAAASAASSATEAAEADAALLGRRFGRRAVGRGHCCCSAAATLLGTGTPGNGRPLGDTATVSNLLGRLGQTLLGGAAGRCPLRCRCRRRRMDLLQVAAAAAAEPFVPEPLLLLLMLPLVQLQGPPVLPVGQGSAGTAASASAAAERRCFANGLLLLRDRLLLWKGFHLAGSSSFVIFWG